MATPPKKLQPSRSQTIVTMENLKISENSDPNIPMSPPLSPQKQTKSLANRSTQSKKVDTKTPGRVVAPRIQLDKERKFIIARKSSRRAGNRFDFEKCRKEAYETLRASQEEFFRQKIPSGAHSAAGPATNEAVGLTDGAEKDGSNGAEKILVSEFQDPEAGSEVMKIESSVKEARNSMPEPGSGQMRHLVEAFQSLLSISKDDEAEKSVYRNLNDSNWALSGLQQSAKNAEVDASSTSVFSSVEFFPSSGIASELGLYDSVNSNDGRLSWGNRTSVGGGRNKRNSCELRRSWNKMLRVTSQQPFKLRTEQRGRIKEERFIKKVKDMLMEEEKQRIPIAQGLPWTTDEPEHLVKPPVKQSTEPIDIVLHSDVRAVERAEFDQFIAERMCFADQLRWQREMQQKLDEEEEIRRLRRELVPKAQPMPYFANPFVPKKSDKPRTIPKEPRFHIRPRRSSCFSASMFER